MLNSDDTQTDTQTDGRDPLGIGSGGMIYIPSFIKIGSDILKLIEGNTHRHTDSMVIS
jgi:hypothetical protein